MRQFGSHGDGPGQFESILSVSSDGTGNLYVSDYRRVSMCLAMVVRA